MGHNPSYRKWSPSQWRDVAPSVGDLRRLEWRVESQCMACELRMVVDLDRVIAAKGATFVLWGRSTPCRRIGCHGSTWFYTRPPRAGNLVPMF